ncbi:MAG: carbon-nitrogen family hydrolase [Eubacteriales bacterium]|nr:carbon-nitrogen family hydrolase [Eubacteriales bacterium]
MKAVLIQLAVPEYEQPRERSQRVQQLLSRVAEGRQPCDLLLLPELWKNGFSNFEQYARNAELPGGIIRTFSRWSQRLSCTIIPGSFLEKHEDGSVTNTTPLLLPDGSQAAAYRKLHLFGYHSRESKLLRAGDGVTVVDTPIGRVGLATCYDLRFPEQFRAMVDAGAQIFCVTAAWPQVRLTDWRLLCRVRALENQCFLFACNHAGEHAGVVGGGHSMAVAPDGTILAEAAEGETVLTVEFDPKQVVRVREQFPVLRDRVEIR